MTVEWLGVCAAVATMAENANQSNKQGYTLPLKVLVDKETNKVLFAEAGKDFVDVLLSFLTLPMGTIARLVAKDSKLEAWVHCMKACQIFKKNIYGHRNANKCYCGLGTGWKLVVKNWNLT